MLLKTGPSNRRQNPCGLSSLNCLLITGISVFYASVTTAQNIPATAEIDRIQPLRKLQELKQTTTVPAVKSLAVELAVPANADQVKIPLQSVTITGNTVFTDAELRRLYASALFANSRGTKQPLSIIWDIANAINSKYRAAGYFLSRAYIPEQDVTTGKVTIRVVEGYIHNVSITHPIGQQDIVKRHIRGINQQQPITTKHVESLMLRLNDLGGVNFFGSLKPSDTTPGAVQLVLDVKKQAGQGLISADNHGSRFLGPISASATYQTSLIPTHQTALSVVSSIPTDELKYIAVNHIAPLTTRLNLIVAANTIDAQPGATLEDNDLNSNATDLGVTLEYQAIRQRLENLAFRLTLDGKNSNGDVFGDQPLTRDRVRTIRLGASYDKTDTWNGYNALNVTLSQGLSWLGASEKGNANLSRAQADPTFRKAELSYSRQQYINENFTAIGRLNGQYSNSSLFSSEEFGYGGQQFGRAYDPSEITGDHGLAVGLEVRHKGWQALTDTTIPATFQPYIFSDIGKVWEKDSNTENSDITAASAGAGLSIALPYNFSTDLAVAIPLIKPINTPLYGDNKHPRFLMQVGYRF